MLDPVTDHQIVWGIAEKAAKAFKVSPQSIFGHGRWQPLARARQAVMGEAHLQGLSYPRIGYVLNRDHTTIMHGAKRALARGDVRP